MAWLCVLLLLTGLPPVKAYITDCSKPITLPEVKFKDLTLEEAVAYLKQSVKKLDGLGSGDINVIIVGASDEQKKKKISLDAHSILLRDAMDHIARTVGLRLRVDAHAVVLAPPSETLTTRTYRVPPNFISAGSAAK